MPSSTATLIPSDRPSLTSCFTKLCGSRLDLDERPGMVVLDQRLADRELDP
jgi:hypothetical protein